MKHILATAWLTLALTSPVRAEVAQVVCRNADGDALALLVNKDARTIDFEVGSPVEPVTILWWTERSIAFSLVNTQPNAAITMILFLQKMELTVSVIREDNMVLDEDLNAMRSFQCTRPL